MSALSTSSIPTQGAPHEVRRSSPRRDRSDHHEPRLGGRATPEVLVTTGDRLWSYGLFHGFPVFASDRARAERMSAGELVVFRGDLRRAAS